MTLAVGRLDHDPHRRLVHLHIAAEVYFNRRKTSGINPTLP
jgi:hypothetical protein